ncbi:uncharacterized protein LOC131628653 [Vicia villosa]|uniref:uncharacterized protein LOC131628653 n=1 Tax=Vicia villosa TaxID=3911 RepID=UPI00273B98D9|nr:uncharacterized protein LOC131628653 [Vicia villosa]
MVEGLHGGWQQVHRQKKLINTRRWDNEKTKGRGMGEDSNNKTTFFFTSFPEKLGAKQMYEIFQTYGDIDEVIIPNKRDKRGMRYGFVRFFGVIDSEFLATKLDNIFLENKKIFVNLPRFQRKVPFGNQEKRKDAIGDRGKQVRGQQWTQNPGLVRRGGDSEAGLRKGSFMEVLNSKAPETNERKQPLIYDQPEEDLERFRKAFTGFTSKPGMSYNLQEIFNARGHIDVKITPLGANMCLVEDLKEGVISSLLKKAESWMKQWFREIHPWKPSDIDYERIAWLRCYGIPCQVWNEDFLVAC